MSNAKHYFDPERAADVPDADDLIQHEEVADFRERAEDFHADDGGPFEAFCDWE